MEIKLARPVTGGRVSQWFGTNADKYKRFGLAGHSGLDYAVPIGTPVLAAHSGTVYVMPEDRAGFGLYVKVVSGKLVTLYAHLSQINAKTGQQVACGEIIGHSGSTGNSTGPHLHFGLKIVGMRNQAYGDYIDPVPFRED